MSLGYRVVGPNGIVLYLKPSATPADLEALKPLLEAKQGDGWDGLTPLERIQKAMSERQGVPKERKVQ